MTKFFVASLAACIAGLASLNHSSIQDGQKLTNTPSKFMQRKLDHAKQIISGLATENYAEISKAAQDLLLLSHETDWNVIQSPSYLRMSDEFRGSATRLREAAHAKNIDGATLAYFEVTLNCVRCHKQLREEDKKLRR